jgi:hypothetical protein
MVAVERGEDFPLASPPVYLVRYDSAATVVDTVAVSRAPPHVPRRGVPDVAGAYQLFSQPIYAPRPVWATGDGWLALGHGDSTAVHVITLAGDTLLRIEWPEASREVTEEDRYAYADWRLSEEVDKGGEGGEEVDSGAGRDRARRQIELELWPYAERRPQVTAALGSGPCLWLAGFDPADNPWGASLTWYAIDVVRGAPAAVVRIPRVGSRLREVGPQTLYATYVAGDATVRMERYPLPESACSSGTDG